MNNVIGICNLYDEPKLGELNTNRSLGSVTFLGRYGLMDFTLSNFSNSGIDKMYVLCSSGAQTIRNHVGAGNIWINNTKNGYLRLLMNEKVSQTSKFNTDISCVLANYAYFEHSEADYIVVAPTFFLMSYDYREAISAHVKSGADVSVVYTHATNADKEYLNCDLLTINNRKDIIDFKTNNGDQTEANVSLESFIFSKKSFENMIQKSKEVSQLYTIRKMIVYAVKNKLAKVKALRFDGYVAPLLSFDSYVKYSEELLSYETRRKLFLEDWPVYTTTHNTPPAIYGENAVVSNSFVANGSLIKGKVINSIISRDVTIEEGAVVENSILFTRTYVGNDVHVKNVVTDKNVHIDVVKDVHGSEEEALFIETGAKI